MKLHEVINEKIQNEAISMHVPGHKNNTIGRLSDLDWRYDMTEIEGLDDLHEPSGVLHQLNDQIATKYEGYKAQIMVNGTTNGIISAIYALSKTHERFIVIEGAHKSVYHGLDLTQSPYEEITLDEVYIWDIRQGDVVLLTYPTYIGECFDIEKVIQHIHTLEGLVLTDEAHGAHLDIAEGFPHSSMKFRSDITVQSYHKMLPALTMASVLFVRDEKLFESIIKYIDYFETSSPSYLIMLSIEQAHTFYKSYSAEEFFHKRAILIETMEEAGLQVSQQDDPAKVLLEHEELTPFMLRDVFTDLYIYPEMVTDKGVLFCLPLFHIGDTYPFSQLLERIRNMDFKAGAYEPVEMQVDILEGVRCVKSLIPYPPGVPLVLENEMITQAHIKSIKHYMNNRVRIEGIKYNIEYYSNEDNQ